MSTWTPWRTNPTVYRTNTGVSLTNYAHSQYDRSASGAVMPGPAGYFDVDAYAVDPAAAPSGWGIFDSLLAGQQAHNRPGGGVFVSVASALMVFDAHDVLTPATPNIAYLNRADPTDPDLATALDVEFEAPHGTRDDSLGFTVSFDGGNPDPLAIPAPWGQVDALRLTYGTEWLFSTVSPGYVQWQGVTLDDAGRWASAAAIPTSDGQIYKADLTVSFASLDAGRYLAYQLRAGGADWAMSPDDDWRIEFFGRCRATGWYRSSRYRLLLPSLPPLRQYPRDDALGGAPRQGKTGSSQSVQGSSRQGWTNTYR